MSDRVTVSPERLTAEMKKSLDEYGSLSSEALKATIDEVSEAAAEEAKKAAPVDSSSSRRGKYQKSIRPDTEYEDSHSKRTKIWASGHEYSLSHLLENGHDLIGHMGKAKGTRIGHTGEFPHFEKAESYVEEHFEEELKKKLEG